jgi:hypothetical protein
MMNGIDIIEVILQEYPDKGEAWARYQWQRCVDNIDEELTDEVIVDLLEHEFEIKVRGRV